MDIMSSIIHPGLLIGRKLLEIVTNLDNQVSDNYYWGFTCYVTSASQIWLLGRLLPMMVGDRVPDDDAHWICFINLLQILCIATAFEITPDAVAVIGMLIEDYLSQFVALYPGSITPKIHYLLHLVRQIQL